MIYTTGYTQQGVELVGGIWTLFDQEGFPIEMSYLKLKQDGKRVDWIEAMASASLSNNLPSLVAQMSLFMGESELNLIKVLYSTLLKLGKTPEIIMEMKRLKAPTYPPKQQPVT